MPKAKFPTYDEIIAGILRTATGPMPAAEVADKLLAARPSQAKNPRQAARQHLREAAGRLLIFVDHNTVLPLRLACQGARFRLPLDREAVSKGLVGVGDLLPSYLPWGFPAERMRLIDSAGQPIAFQLRKLTEKVDTPLGRTTIETLYADLRAWLRAEQARAKDWLLLTIVDWEQGVIRLVREPSSQYDPGQHAARNRLLAELFYEFLESAAAEMVTASEAVPTAYARLPDKGGYPPDHWLAVVAADERLYTDGWLIRYRDSGASFFDRLLGDWPGEPRSAPARRFSREEAAQVYRFKATLAQRPNLWRRIEIQGKHTLADLDRMMRGAFEHDTWDHLGGFWRLVPRGTQPKSGRKAVSAARRTRYREVELGNIDPFGGGDGADVKIASLELAVGDQLKYVYDFGDWIEHRLMLEAIAPPEPRVKYPREVDRNQPEYAGCVECQKKGRQTVAKWICLECSDRRGEEVLLCDECSAKRHAEHYVEAILY